MLSDRVKMKALSSIGGGKKVARGTVRTTTANEFLEIRGLDFRPGIIIVVLIGRMGRDKDFAFFVDTSSLWTESYFMSDLDIRNADYLPSDSASTTATIFNDGFRIRPGTLGNQAWIAIENLEDTF